VTEYEPLDDDPAVPDVDDSVVVHRLTLAELMDPMPGLRDVEDVPDPHRRFS
jgi:hypothetical protein